MFELCVEGLTRSSEQADLCRSELRYIFAMAESANPGDSPDFSVGSTHPLSAGAEKTYLFGALSDRHQLHKPAHLDNPDHTGY